MNPTRILVWGLEPRARRAADELGRSDPDLVVGACGADARPGADFDPKAWDAVLLVAPDNDCRSVERFVLALQDVTPDLPIFLLCPKAFDSACEVHRAQADFVAPCAHVVCIDRVAGAARRALSARADRVGRVRAEQRYQELFERVPIGLFQRRPDGTFLDLNPAMAEILGCFSREELLGRRVDDFYLDPSDRERFEAELEARDEVRDWTVRIRRADGRPSWVSVNARAVRDEKGRLLYIEGATRCIDERVSARQSLERSEARYRSLADAAREAIFVHDGQRILDANRAAEEALGYSREELLALNPLDLIAPEDRDMVRGRIQAGFVGEYEARGLRKDGSVFWGSLRVGPFDWMGKRVRIAVVQDITAYKEAVEAAEAAHRRLQNLMDAVPVGLVLATGPGRVLTSNRAGREALEALGADPHGEVRQVGGRLLAELLTPDGSEVELRSPDHSRWYVLSTHPIETGSQGVLWALVLRDVTEERRLREQAAHQNRLAAVGQLAAGIAHDFNNLLLAITGYAELASQEKGLSEKARARLDDLVRVGFRAADLVRQVLDFSRGTGSEKVPLNLVPLVKETAKMLERTLPDEIRVVTRLDGTDVRVVGSAVEIQQVLMNLALNARDAMPRGGTLTLSLRTLSSGRGPGWAEIAVSDTGAGIPPEVRERVFEPFFTTKETGRGTGLGLAQVAGIVNQHGGRVDLESEPGRGTTVRVFLPLRTARPSTLKSEAEVVPRGRGERVLVVDDDPAVCEITAALVESLGYRVETAADGREAIERVEAGGIDLVLSDVSMPHMGGLELLRALRDRNRTLPVVLLSGFAEPEDLGPEVPFLRKPPTRRALGQLLAREVRRGGNHG
ncbi:PAS domain-containing hybrid sensor histidine kinase/response regulator [Deferrisoma camini]|uniref:PAS domain-containing hybrid sensor histidine kinase/response regulator n=1 Tax=Deferrisoma camini TaxID=1035120 RepID=UPI00046D4C78|nr:PAS domain S-box protein [Deferrisoma camini]